MRLIRNGLELFVPKQSHQGHWHPSQKSTGKCQGALQTVASAFYEQFSSIHLLQVLYRNPRPDPNKQEEQRNLHFNRKKPECEQGHLPLMARRVKKENRESNYDFCHIYAVRFHGNAVISLPENAPFSKYYRIRERQPCIIKHNRVSDVIKVIFVYFQVRPYQHKCEL